MCSDETRRWTSTTFHELPPAHPLSSLIPLTHLLETLLEDAHEELALEEEILKVATFRLGDVGGLEPLVFGGGGEAFFVVGGHGRVGGAQGGLWGGGSERGGERGGGGRRIKRRALGGA